MLPRTIKRLPYLALLLVADIGAAPRNGKVSGTAHVTRDGKPVAGPVVVYLDGDIAGTPAQTAMHAVIKQREKQFEPQLAVVVKGAKIDFPNEDKIFHNVFSVSRPARFDLGLYKSGESKQVEFKRAGTVDVYCNIHPDMVAKVKVLENGYYTISDDKGAFTIDGVPPGKYPVVAWLSTGDEARGEIDVKPGETAKLDLAVEAHGGHDTHTRKDGTPYGRYK